MTTLSKNIKNLRLQRKLTQTKFGKLFNVSGSAVSQWEAVVDPTTPDLDILYAMALEFQTTIEQLVYNANLSEEPTLSPALDNTVLAKLFTLLDKEQSLNYAFEMAPPRMRAYLFAVVYGFIEEGISQGQSDGAMLAFIQQVLSTNEQASKKSVAESEQPNKYTGSR